MEETVWKLRTWIYGLAILAFTFGALYKCSNVQATEIEQECDSGESDGGDSNDFWPPDIIPHPHPPVEPVHDDGMS